MGVVSHRVKFAIVLGLFQVAFIVLMAVFGRYVKRSMTSGSNMESYPNFQDVNVMIFIGFGFLMTFLKKYGYSAVGYNLLISAVCVQWSAIVIGFKNTDILAGNKFEYGVGGMIASNFAAATVLISFGAVLGKTSPVQLMFMAVFEVVFSQINKYICVEYFAAADIGESIYLHMFGAYFGMAVARVLYDPEVENSTKEGSVPYSDLFAMIGTLFLWVYWPSFNGGFAGDRAENAVVNTFLSLCACTVVAFIFSSLLDGKGKFDMVHIQNSTLAGGVAVGACADMPMEPYVAMIIGSLAGIISVMGYKYITPFLASKLKIHDTCGVHNLHGIPAWIAAIASAGIAASASDWGDDAAAIFSEMHMSNEKLTGRSPYTQAGYQLAAAAVTTGLAIITGALTGLILKIPAWNAPRKGNLFEDSKHWNHPEDGTFDKPNAMDTHM